MRFSKLILPAALLACCFSSAYAAKPPSKLPNPKTTRLQELDRIMARVNTDIITQSEFDQAFQFAWKQQQAAAAHGMPAVPQAKLKKIVLEQLIAQKIQLQMAKQQGIKISDKQLNTTIANMAKEHNISTAQLYQEVAKSGLSKAAYRKQIRNQLTIMTIQRGLIGNQANSTPAEIKAYQEAHSTYVYQVGDILIPLSSDPSSSAHEKATAKAELIKKALRDSKNFQKTADQYAPNNNTILTWRPLTDFPDIFVDPIQLAKIHSAAGPVRAPNGLHVLYILGKKKNPHAMTTAQVRNMLYQQKSEKIISPWLKKLRDTSDIQIMGNP